MRIHLIGNAHLDPVWLWRWQEGYAEVKATFRSALDRMDEFPGYVFTCAGACYYRWVEESDPAMFAEIRRRVEEGRWVLAGGWWIQPDCNIPSGESFARHALYSQRYFLEKFGKTASFGYNVDSFGHNGNLPQLLKLAGMENYVMMRPDEREKELPANAFWWEGVDGTRVLTFRIPWGYNMNAGEWMDRKFEAVGSLAREQDTPMMLFYGVGNHGGGPTVQTLRAIEANWLGEGNGGVVYSSPDRYFEELRASGTSFPVVRDDLQHHASGCYSTMSEVKANNRKAECRLINAEKFMTAAHVLLGLPNGARDVQRAWESVLFNQFHDIMGGCSIRDAYDDARDFHGEALKIGGDILNAAVQKLSWAVDTSCGLPAHPGKDSDWALWERGELGAPVVVFNPLSFAVDAPVQLSKSVSQVLDGEGRALPIQKVRAPQTNGEDKWDTLFRAEIPALGYRTFWAHKTAAAEAPAPAGMLRADGLCIENDRLRLEIDGETGAVARLWDKEARREVFAGPGAVPVVIDDEDTDTWAHGVFAFRREIGRFGNAEVRLVEAGPLRATLRVTSRWGRSALRQDFTLYRGAGEVEVAVKLNWQESLKILKLSFPVNADNAAPTYEIPYGAMERRPDGLENPGQAWVDVTGAAPGGGVCGLAVANTAKYSYDVLENELRLTVVRSSIYADHFGCRDEFCECMDQGEQSFRYLLLPHRGGWQDSGVAKRTEALLNPAVAVAETYHRGPLALCGSYLEISADNVIATALKRAEDGGGLVLRCRETCGRAAAATVDLKLAGRRWEAAFGPFEVKTFLVTDGGVAETDLLERVAEERKG